jgi:phosphohistidine phosphatase
LAASEFEEGIEVEFLPMLYHAGVESLRDALTIVSDEVEVLMVVGHNPGWEEVVFRLSDVSVTMKTANAALLEANCEAWHDAFQTTWSLSEVISPKDLE